MKKSNLMQLEQVRQDIQKTENKILAEQQRLRNLRQKQGEMENKEIIRRIRRLADSSGTEILEILKSLDQKQVSEKTQKESERTEYEL